MVSIEVVSHSPEETQSMGRTMGETAGPGDVFLLTGELGAGKTTLTQGVLWGLGVSDFARSPTFVLVSEHQGRLPLFHVDLYRLDAPSDILDLGLEEYLHGEGVCVVEWADKAAGIFAGAHLEVRIEYVSESERSLAFSSENARYDEVLTAVAALQAGR